MGPVKGSSLSLHGLISLSCDAKTKLSSSASLEELSLITWAALPVEILNIKPAWCLPGSVPSSAGWASINSQEKNPSTVPSSRTTSKVQGFHHPAISRISSLLPSHLHTCYPLCLECAPHFCYLKTPTHTSKPYSTVIPHLADSCKSGFSETTKAQFKLHDAEKWCFWLSHLVSSHSSPALDASFHLVFTLQRAHSTWWLGGQQHLQPHSPPVSSPSSMGVSLTQW